MNEFHSDVEHDPDRALKCALELLEKCLETPILAGELLGWITDTQTSWEEVSGQIERHVSEIHPRQYQQISKEDPELMSKVEKLRDEDADLDEDCTEFDRVLRRFAEQAPKFEPDENRVAEHAKALVDEGLGLVTRARKQEVAVRTWFVEAFTRDRGVAD